MEDGFDTLAPLPVHSGSLKNGQVNTAMANCPVADVEGPEKSEVNGGSDGEKKDDTDSDSSAYDALVIDESVKSAKITKPNGKRLKKSRSTFRAQKKQKTLPHVKKTIQKKLLDSDNSEFNPTDPTSLDLNHSETDQPEPELITPEINNVEVGKLELVSSDVKENCKSNCGVPVKGKKNPQLQEYAQYLGLQPTVQFKCVKCKCAGFETLASLNEHSIQCTGTEPVVEPSMSKPATTQFKIHRRVFLCSVCGTYYENWNLFLHMREVHKRFTCLYCLGMFSQPEKLCAHLISKHNCNPSQFETTEEFFTKYKEPCFLMCCECEKVFNEQDDFFHHKCTELGSAIDSYKKVNTKVTNSKLEKKSKSRTLGHVTGDAEVPKCDYENLNASKQGDEVTMNEENSNSQPVEDPVGSDNSLSNNPSIDDENVTRDDPKESVEKSEGIEAEGEEICEKLECEEEDAIESNFEQLIDEQDVKEENYEVRETLDEEENLISEDTNQSIDFSGHNFTDDQSNFTTTEKEDFTESIEQEEPQEEVRKVPKLSLKLSNFTPYNSGDELENDDRLDSDGSEGLVMELDNLESEPEAAPSEDHLLDEKMQEDIVESEEQVANTPQYLVAGPDIPIIELELEQPLDKFEIRALIQRCLNATVSICIYCNHARKIAVNGKQLGLHAIAEHRFSAIVNSITAEELIPDSFNSRIRDSLHELENSYFNLETSSPEEAITFSHVFECFQCRYSTTVHKELYLHNRKMHAKTILLCIMCKSNFYSYSELICHLCPGLYALDSEVKFRCCMCVSDELPSAFRLMVHLRKRHHACDVCLELCNNQSRLSNHVWKHKLHHFCYRCGIAYRNKPDITKHLFWKHGTESVLCKRCLQKKWPHVYHFCMPPASFSCEECNLSFTKAVALMVHKRLHTNELPHACTFQDCTERFISKKLLLKHEFKHREPSEEIAEKIEPPEIKAEEEVEVDVDNKEDDVSKQDSEPEKSQIIPKDIYDLPELNLSESDSSDSEAENTQPVKSAETVTTNILEETPVLSIELDGVNKENGENGVEVTEQAPIIENIWDNFKNYQASKEKSDNLVGEPEKVEVLQDVLTAPKIEELLEVINKDHDYCVITKDEIKEVIQEEKTEVETNLDHDYCSAAGSPSKTDPTKDLDVKPKKEGDSSDSSSDSDSSSCTCGSNCSCSSSSGSSSSSSDSSGSDSSTSEGRRKKLLRKEQRKQQKLKAKEQSKQEAKDSQNKENASIPQIPPEISIQESDLETTETDTDEDFYDEHPQRLAKQLLAEKRNKLLQMASGEPVNGSFIETSRPSTPSLPEEMKPKKKSKSKKRKKKKSSKYSAEPQILPNIPTNNNQISDEPAVSPFSIFARQSPTVNTLYTSPRETNSIHSNPTMTSGLNHKPQPTSAEPDSNLRASKRKRVPNKFYGYSSDEDREKVQSSPVLKWRKMDYSPSQPSPLVVPPLTIKTIPPPPPKQVVEPISIRTSSNPGEFRVQNLHTPMRSHHIRPFSNERETGSDSNDSSSDEDEENSVPPPVKEQAQLYCYCRCPYDEVSEMIGCDNKHCAIEWFHFECVGIMVPPKGQWYCPDCRKKKQQRRENLQTQ